MIETVLLDLDDTLFDHRHASMMGVFAVREAFAELQSVPIEELIAYNHQEVERFHQLFLRGEVRDMHTARVERYRVVLRRYGAIGDDEQSLMAANLYRQAYVNHQQTLPGAHALLVHLRRQAKIVIVTNNTREEQVPKLALLGLADQIDQLVTPADVGMPKPAPAIFTHALETVGGRVDRAVMLGDSWLIDVCGALDVGMRAVWLNREAHPPPELGRVPVITSLEPTESVAALLLNAT